MYEHLIKRAIIQGEACTRALLPTPEINIHIQLELLVGNPY